MKFNKYLSVTLAALAIALTATITVAQNAGVISILPQSSGSENWQGEMARLTPASAELTEAATVNVDNTVAWSAGGGNRPVLFIPDADFELSTLEEGGTAATAGYVLEFQFSESAIANSSTRSVLAQQSFTETAGLAELEITHVEGTSYQADLRGGNDVVLISFRFELTNDDLDSIDNGGSVTVPGENNADAGPLYELEEITLTLAESGQIVIAAFTFTEFD